MSVNKQALLPRREERYGYNIKVGLVNFEEGAGVVIIGLLVHMMLSIIYGLVYAAAVDGVTHEF